MTETMIEETAAATVDQAVKASETLGLLEKLLAKLIDWAMDTGIKILLSLIILLITFKIINWIGRKIMKAGKARNIDLTILKTLVYALKLVAKCIIIVCIVGYLGIDTSGITALIASLGVCIGLAVNGAVANLAGGVLILLTRPFKVDDFIEAQGVSGVVSDIRITHTVVVTGDNKVVHIPNGELSNGNVINYSEKDTRRVDMEFSIAYDADYDRAKAIITEILSSNEAVIKDNPVFVKMSAHGESSIQIKARAWTASASYWSVYFDTLEAVKREFDKNGIEIPFRQVDVHIKNQ